MAKRSIFSRISQMVRANTNAMLDQAEDPEKMLEQMVRDFTGSISEAEQSAAEFIGNVRMLEQDYEQHRSDAQDWGNKALAASQKADTMRTKGDTAGADRFDELAKVALQRQMDADDSAQSLGRTVEAQRSQVSELRNGLDQMRIKRDQLVKKRDELILRARTAEIQSRAHAASKQIDAFDPTSDLSRFEDNVRKIEAKSRGEQELAASSMDAQFNELESLGETAQQTEIEARLAALKSGGEAPQLGSGND